MSDKTRKKTEKQIPKERLSGRWVFAKVLQAKEIECLLYFISNRCYNDNVAVAFLEYYCM